MRSSDFFVEEPDDPWGVTSAPAGSLLREDLLVAARQGRLADVDDVALASGLLDLTQEELEAYGTGGGHRLTYSQIAEVIRTLEVVTGRVGRPLKLPFRDFTRFRSWWSRNGAHGSWQARRDLIDQLLDPTRDYLNKMETAAFDPAAIEERLSELRDPAAIQDNLGRMRRAVMDDPALAIGSAKELVESTAKTVLTERGLVVNDKDDLPALVSQSQRALGVHPTENAAGPDTTEAVRRILGGLVTVTSGLTELRNRGYGTGHGPSGARVGLRSRHAHLAVNSAIAWCQFMLDTLADPEAPWRSGA